LSGYQAQPLPAIDAPLVIETVDDEVVFIGPGAVAFAKARAAARETALRLRAVLDADEEHQDGSIAP
jgi:hypothetical protein